MKINGGKPVKGIRDPHPERHNPGMALARLLGAETGPAWMRRAAEFNDALKGLVKGAVHEALEECAGMTRTGIDG